MGHIPVLLNEFLEQFDQIEIETFFDGTLGAGGHAEALLKAHPEIKTYIGCDRDQNSLKMAKERLEPWAKKMKYVHGNFANLDKHLKELGISEVDGFFLTWGYHPCS